MTPFRSVARRRRPCRIRLGLAHARKIVAVPPPRVLGSTRPLRIPKTTVAVHFQNVSRRAYRRFFYRLSDVTDLGLSAEVFGRNKFKTTQRSDKAVSKARPVSTICPHSYKSTESRSRKLSERTERFVVSNVKKPTHRFCIDMSLRRFGYIFLGDWR